MDRGGRRAHDPGDHGSLSFDRWIALGTLAAFGLGLWLALKLASRLTSAVQGLVGPALALGEGRPVEVPRTHVKEAVEVGTALQQASRMWPMLSIWRTTTH